MLDKRHLKYRSSKRPGQTKHAWRQWECFLLSGWYVSVKRWTTQELHESETKEGQVSQTATRTVPLRTALGCFHLSYDEMLGSLFSLVLIKAAQWIQVLLSSQYATCVLYISMNCWSCSKLYSVCHLFTFCVTACLARFALRWLSPTATQLHWKATKLVCR